MATFVVSPEQAANGVILITGEPNELRIAKELDLDVAEQFAPGFEDLEIIYDIRGMEFSTVVLQVQISATSEIIFERFLSLEEKTEGIDKRLTWDGVATDGSLNGRVVGPAHSPYRVVLKGNGKQANIEVEVKIGQLTLTSDIPSNNRMFMNAVGNKFRFNADVLIVDSNGVARPSSAETSVHFTFEDPGSNNATDAGSHQLTPGVGLGKTAEPNARFFKKLGGSQSSSADDFRTEADVIANATGANQGQAGIKFHPSGVGGDDYIVKAQVLASNGTTVLADAQSPTLEVWRRLTFKTFEMDGQTFISSEATDAKMLSRYSTDTFVQCNLDPVVKITGVFVVQYIGLWDTTSQSQLNWLNWQRKIASTDASKNEVPTAPDTAAANNPTSPSSAARARITVLAQRWHDRIDRAANIACIVWAADAGIPLNSLIGVQFSHPKQDALAPLTDATTNEWSAFPWLRVNAALGSVHPDTRWDIQGGFATGNRAYVLSGINSTTKIQDIIAHEAGHESLNQFKRGLFGPGDHTPAPTLGLMDRTGSQSTFNANEKAVLRGF